MTADALPPRPEPPLEEECCGRGCSPCIFDYYEAALTRWRERLLALGVDPDRLDGPPPP